MSLPRPNEEFLLLQRLQKVKETSAPQTPRLGPEMVSFFKSVEKRQGKFGKIGQVWMALVPDEMSDHCSLDSLVRGTLTVLVDSSSHLHELKLRMLEGLERKMVEACKRSGLRKIVLKAGQCGGPEDRLKGR